MNSRTDLISLAPSVVVAIAYSLYLLRMYKALPQKLATHFDLHGTPNGYMTKQMFGSFTLLLMWFAIVLCGAILYWGAGTSSNTLLVSLSVVVGLQAASYWQLIVGAVMSKPPNLLWMIPGAIIVCCATFGMVRLSSG